MLVTIAACKGSVGAVRLPCMFIATERVQKSSSKCSIDPLQEQFSAETLQLVGGCFRELDPVFQLTSHGLKSAGIVRPIG